MALVVESFCFGRWARVLIACGAMDLGPPSPSTICLHMSTTRRKEAEVGWASQAGIRQAMHTDDWVPGYHMSSHANHSDLHNLSESRDIPLEHVQDLPLVPGIFPICSHLLSPGRHPLVEPVQSLLTELVIYVVSCGRHAFLVV